MIRTRNKKIKIILSASVLILLVGLVSGFVWMNMGGKIKSKAVGINSEQLKNIEEGTLKTQISVVGSPKKAALYLTATGGFIPAYLPTLASDEQIDFLSNQASSPRYILITNKQVYINASNGNPSSTWNTYPFPGTATRMVGMGCRGYSCLYLGNNGEIYYTNSLHGTLTDHSFNLSSIPASAGVSISNVKDFYAYVTRNNTVNEPRGIASFQIGNSLRFVKLITGTSPQWVTGSFPDFNFTTHPEVASAKIISIDGAVDNDCPEEVNSNGRPDYSANPGPEIIHENIYLYFDNNKIFRASARGTSWTDISSSFPEFSIGKLIPHGTTNFDIKHNPGDGTPLIPAGSPFRHMIVQSNDGTVHFIRYDNIGTQGDVGQKKTCKVYQGTPSFSSSNIDFLFAYSDTCDINNPTFCGNGIQETGEDCATCPEDMSAGSCVSPPAPTPPTPVAIPDAFLKDLGYTTAETLLFTPTESKQNRQWGLLKGVGAISVNGGANWQKSAAEVLYIGTMPVAHITKTGDSYYVVAGGTTEYNIDFYVVDTPGLLYDATIVDNINIKPADTGAVTVVDASIVPNSIMPYPSNAPDCGGIAIGSASNVSPFTPSSRQITFNIKNATRGCNFRLKVKLNIDKSADSNTSIEDSAEISGFGGGKSDVPFTTIIIGPFAKEQTGGDVYAKGNLNFGDLPPTQYGAKYVLGADGNVESTSEQNWILKDYSIRSGSTTDFSPDDCTKAGTACKTMNDNIEKLKKGATSFANSTISGFPASSTPDIPEGKAFYHSGNLNIDAGGSNVIFSGKGTIVVENGDVNIKSNMIYDTSKPSILGIIVKNGNVVVSPGVENVSAIFYIYSDRGLTGSKGSFIVNTVGTGDDKRFTLTGAVVASGVSASVDGVWKRTGAFILSRNYVGSRELLEDAIRNGLDYKVLLQSAELFLYDSRIILNPPPGFGGKILGSL